MRLTASLVLFHNPQKQFGVAITSFLRGSNGTLHVVDNSAVPLDCEFFTDSRVRVKFVGKNVGFGAGHNLALSDIGQKSDCHLFLNPDVKFDPDVLPALTEYLRANPDVGAVMPRVTYLDGRPQYLCKMLPTPLDLLLRRFIPFVGLREFLNRRYEMRSLPIDTPSEVPVLSGCFLLARTEILRDIGGFDERFFMYMEDVDLVRRIGDKARTIYLPTVCIHHAYGKGSYRNVRLLSYHLRSAVIYFFKWGWWFDGVRRKRNADAKKLLSRKSGDI